MLSRSVGNIFREGSLTFAISILVAFSAANAQLIDIETTKVESQDPLQRGDVMNYTISVNNKGTLAAPNVTFNDPLPKDIIFDGFVSISQGAATFSNAIVTGNFGPIDPGVTASLVFKVKLTTNIKSPPVLTISSPQSLARDYHVWRGTFSPQVLGTGPITELLAADDGSGTANDACEELLESSEQALFGRIGVIRSSGLCLVEAAAARVANAGAVAVIVVSADFKLNLEGGGLVSVNVPVLSITNEDGNEILGALASGSVSGNLSILSGQFLNTVRAHTTGIDVNPSNNLALQYTAFLNDTDGDGIPDVDDKCPELPGAPQDDSDNDGLGDVCDPCTDGDSDGLGDPGFPLNVCPLDECVSDSNKGSPGICGCGISDVDQDSDGVVDCLDQCPADMNKSSPGICGCGTADVDLNNNGITDCILTSELAFRIDLALTSLGAAKSKKGVLTKKIKQALKIFRGQLADIDAFITSGATAFQLKGSQSDFSKLAQSVQNAGAKALKFRSGRYEKRRKSAVSALEQLLALLVL